MLLQLHAETGIVVSAIEARALHVTHVPRWRYARSGQPRSSLSRRGRVRV